MLAGQSSTFTNSGDLLGTWTGKQGNVSGKGCSAASNFFAVCYQWQPADPGEVSVFFVLAQALEGGDSAL